METLFLDESETYTDSLIKQTYEKKIQTLQVLVLSLQDSNEKLITENVQLIDLIKKYKQQINHDDTNVKSFFSTQDI
tara:strand:+ start:28 stop:258 length:231 start_codon:yes stop_codon:yes gene_type:complete